MKDIYVTKALYEKNADNGLAVHEDKQALADAVLEIEDSGGSVRVFRCVPMEHVSYTKRAGIELTDLD